MLQMCLCFFQVCGFYPINVKRNEQNIKKLSINLRFLLMSIFHSFLIIGFFSYVLIQRDEMLYAKTVIGTVCDILVYFSMIFAHFMIVTEAFVKRKFLVKFWIYRQKYLKLTKQRAQKFDKIISLKVFLFVILTIVSEVIVIRNIELDQQWTNFWFASIFSLCLCRFRHLQQVLFVDIIFFSLKDLNCSLRAITLWSKALGDEKAFVKSFMYKNMKISEKKLKSLMEMVICVNKIFCWSQVFNFGQNFLEISACLFWIYDSASGPDFLWGEYELIVL